MNATRKGEPHVAVLGAGNWGTTVADLVTKAGGHARLWTRSPEQRDEINRDHRNHQFTGDAAISPQVTATSDLAEAVRGARLVLVIVPSKAFREVSRKLGDLLMPDQIVIHGAKGLELGTHKRMSEILLEETCAKQIGVLAGPNIAPEILSGHPAGTVIASHFPRVIEAGRRTLGCPTFRVFSGDDVAGAEYAGAFKNVVAIAAGVADELGLGENAKAMLITRGISEIAQLGVHLGASPTTFFGMSGIGDLVVTCASKQSRNNRLGVALARGLTLAQALDSLGMVAEGVNTAKAVHELLAGRAVQPPLFDHVYRVLFEGLAPRDALHSLMSLQTGHDVNQVLR